jgi:hypothetical protein
VTQRPGNEGVSSTGCTSNFAFRSADGGCSLYLIGRSLILRMRVFRQFGVLLLLLVSCLAPAMACMVPDAQMNTEERACCRIMKNQCGQMDNMPASHGCCQKAPASVHDNALDTKTVVFHPVVTPVIWLAAFELVNPTTIVTGWVERPDYSPPKSPPATISILRI